MKNSIMMKRT